MKLTREAIAIAAASLGGSSASSARMLNGTEAVTGNATVLPETNGTEADPGNAIVLPEINELMNMAFPMWEVDENGNRVETKECKVDSCEWNPYYITKRYDGLHPDLGGHPTDNDVKYAFYGSSPFGGQPYPGTPHHCAANATDDVSIGDCPKVVTLSDSSPQGPGHVPPHIALMSLTEGVGDELFAADEMFDYDSSQCRVVPDVLFRMIRNYFPRTEGEAVKYPPPIVPEGGDYQYEFPSGNGIDKQTPPYEPGSPHWCTEEFKAAGGWADFCPYVFDGPDAGKYRHPHIAYAALEVYLAHEAMPDKCGATWLENNPDFIGADHVATNTPFPIMDADDKDATTVENWLGQPVLPLNYTSGDARPGAVVMSAEASAKLINLDAAPTGSNGNGTAPTPATPSPTAATPSSAFVTTGSVAAATIISMVVAIAM
eukprot:CAMPEP_0172545624 /NCGR_PEP_ID=MMETSP1067-20121228/15497_1 /TAXON_ID=265564 ORGANISM="Thalassiosira punctigera, Strain Tpunct2005C2" /NCGR_SAMPLE_ID=MMETSP1067 /ASSEMBLY_ACC=CAM_ASM_000444 /LENGTH=430 /DNA_ID=CAMNT_0013332403 /DNA_START=134 /DNA_END=1426 /DNA_ORIENTATION=+